MELVRTCYPSLRSIFQSFIGLWGQIGHRNKATRFELKIIDSCAKYLADLNWRPVLEKGVCSDWNRTAHQLQMAARKSLEIISDMNLNRTQQSLESKPLQTKWYVWKPYTDQRVISPDFSSNRQDFFPQIDRILYFDRILYLESTGSCT